MSFNTKAISSSTRLYRTAFVAIFLFGIGLMLSATWKDMRYGDPFMAKMAQSSKKNYDIILFGDSVITTSSRKDSSAQSITQFLEADLKHTVFDASRPGLNLAGICDVMKLMPRPKRKAEIAIIEINPLILTSLQSNNPRYDRWLNKFSAAVGNGSPSLAIAKHITYASDSSSMLDKQVDLEAAYMSKDFITRNSLNKQEVNSEIESTLEKMFSTSKDLANHTLFFITPVDCKNVLYCEGNEALKLLEARHQAIIDALNKLNVPYIDFMKAVPGKVQFLDKTRMHLDSEGRQFIAHELAEAIGEQGFLKHPSSL